MSARLTSPGSVIPVMTTFTEFRHRGPNEGIIMSSIYIPRFTAGQRIAHQGRPGTILRNGRDEGSVVFQFDDCPDEYFAHERNLDPLDD